MTEVHVVSKLDNQQHASVTLPAEEGVGQLAESSIRVRTLLVSLTSNNLSYARAGHVLRWWDTYPVSEHYPAPYNDPSTWGIVPAWGYAAVEESTIPELSKGAVLWGFWPTSSLPTDLKLNLGKRPGDWTEISEHRQQLMPLYNYYTTASVSESISVISNPGADSPSVQDERERLAWTSIFGILWRAGYLLSEHVFPSHPEKQAIHPLGSVAGLDWTAADGDLSSAVVVSLAASTKTGHAFAYNLQRRLIESAPLGLLQVTSSVARISKAEGNSPKSFPSKIIDYADVAAETSAKWMADLKPSKIVVLDFGARSNALDQFLDLVKKDPVLQSSKVMIVMIGGQQKVYTNEELQAAMKAIADLGKIQYNTSGVQETLLETLGSEEYYGVISKLWDEWLVNRHLNVPGFNIIWGKGISGVDGIEGGWGRLSRGEVGSEEGLVYTVSRT